jgi:hypothetical protein
VFGVLVLEGATDRGVPTRQTESRLHRALSLITRLLARHNTTKIRQTYFVSLPLHPLPHSQYASRFIRAFVGLSVNLLLSQNLGSRARDALSAGLTGNKTMHAAAKGGSALASFRNITDAEGTSLRPRIATHICKFGASFEGVRYLISAVSYPPLAWLII